MEGKGGGGGGCLFPYISYIGMWDREKYRHALV